MNPQVSVIIAAYNCEDTINYAIASVLQQSFQNFEVIVVDDASTDRTAEVVKKINDTRIRILRHEKNRGPAAARNTALEVARGAWAAVLDADDAWHADRLKLLVQYAKRYPNAFFGDDIMLCLADTSGGLVPWKSLFQSRRLVLKDDLNPVEFNTLVKYGIDIKPFFPLETIRFFRISQWEEAFGAEWLYFNAQLMRAGLNLYLINRPMYYYRVSGKHLSSEYKSILCDIMVCQRLLGEEWMNERTRQLLRKRLSLLRRRLPWSALRQGLWYEASRAFWCSPASILYLLQRIPGLFQRWTVSRFNALTRSKSYKI